MLIADTTEAGEARPIKLGWNRACPVLKTRPRPSQPREKLFGDGRPRPMDRNAKARLMVFARALMRRAEKGKHYGVITAKALAVLEALLFAFHNAKSGLCYPRYETIAARADCARSTVAQAIKILESAGILGWVHRIARQRFYERDLFGGFTAITKVVRTSNGYYFRDQQPSGRPDHSRESSKSEVHSGTTIKNYISLPTTELHAENPLELVLSKLKEGIRRREGALIDLT
jgi:hypothetical protein